MPPVSVTPEGTLPAVKSKTKLPTVSTSVAVPEPLALVAVRVTLLTAVAAGVPLMSPVAVSIDKPDGKPVAA